jgi:glycine/D-amino acid oxidase-like deaminating enzyme
MRVVVVGGGVIGTSIAWRLAAKGADVTVVERTAIACAASGRSGGFLAKDWCEGTPLMYLARRSFDLHAELVEELEGDWGYRRVTTCAGIVGRPTTLAPRGPSREWISSDVEIRGRIGSVGTTAQVNPAAFTIGMMRAVRARGAELKLGTVTGLKRRGGNVVGVDLKGSSSKPMRLSSRWGRGQCSPHVGFRFRPCGV